MLAAIAIGVLVYLIVQKNRELGVTPEMKQAQEAQLAKGKVQKELNDRRDAQQAVAERAEIQATISRGSVTFWFVLLIVVWIAGALSYIYLPIFMYRDSVVRGMPTGVAWVALGLATWLVAFLIYLFARPQSSVVLCGYCKQRCIWYRRECVHCGAEISRTDTTKLGLKPHLGTAYTL